jgi:glycosyltransferase involved in cell wall biosynthesis
MMGADKFISIITPVYNGIRFIEFCINNVIAQECPVVEHVIVDGGSTDGTVEIIRKYAEKFSHIRWISEKDNGQSDAMNKGITMATGNILSFLNVDDYYEPGALNFVVNKFKGLPEPTLLVGNCNVWDNDGNLLSISRPYKISLKNMLLGKYPEAFPMNPSAYFYHKSLHEFIGYFEVDEHYGMDLHFIFKSLKLKNALYVDRTLGNYRFLEGTKTFNDVKSGNNSPRVRKITAYYLNAMPWWYKIYIYVLRCFSVMSILRHIKNRLFK